MVRKSFSPNSSATCREEENAPANNAPSDVALRLVPDPWVAITCPLLSISMTEVALVSFISLFNTVEIKASSRSEMTRLVSCSIYAPPSVHAQCSCNDVTLYQELQEFRYGLFWLNDVR